VIEKKLRRIGDGWKSVIVRLALRIDFTQTDILFRLVLRDDFHRTRFSGNSIPIISSAFQMLSKNLKLSGMERILDHVCRFTRLQPEEDEEVPYHLEAVPCRHVWRTV
jgi:hypothetical protein